jgi:benzoyl-CoA reductase/2-hydroxyglutaryl-CoA dehydratase subunit BcrC/BadD/HgdB
LSSSSPQFDDRYRVEPPRGEDPGARKRARFIAEQQKQIMAGIKHRPANIAWFQDLVDAGAAEGPGPLVGYFCNMIPAELVYALGARPVRLDCGNPALVPAGEEALSGEICPLAKASFASFLDGTGLAARCAALVLPSSCDAKRKLGEVLADFKPTFTFNLPPEQDADRYGKSAAAEVERLGEFLAAQLGRRLSTAALLEAIELTRRRSALVRELQAARAADPAAMSVRDLFLVVQASFTGVGLAEWLAQAGQVLAGVRAFQSGRKRLRPRLVLTGAPIVWPNFKPLNLIEESGADVVADTVCTGAQSCFDPVVYDERSRSALLRALAHRYVFASSCPCFISQGTRLSRVLDLVAEFKADGVVSYGLRLCQLFDMEAYRLSRVLKARKIPFANLRTDYSLEDTEQLRVRLEAFLETLGE